MHRVPPLLDPSAPHIPKPGVWQPLVIGIARVRERQPRVARPSRHIPTLGHHRRYVGIVEDKTPY